MSQHPHVSATPRTVGARLRVAAVAVGLLGALVVPAAQASGAAEPLIPGLDRGLPVAGDAAQAVIVTALGGPDAAARAVVRAGGTVGASLPLVGGVQARVAAGHLPALADARGVVAVTADRQASFQNTNYDASRIGSAFPISTQATAAWSDSNLGEGVGVAVLDTGISDMPDFSGRLVHGPDLSGEGTVADSFGHGTVMAGAIGGSGVDSPRQNAAWTGVAPRATLVSVKVAGRNGAVDVSTILQGMHWVSAYADQFNIRVLNLSWGVPSTQDPRLDPLNYAVERLWRQGIVVVVAAGNTGPSAGTILKPADDPLVLTVGAYDDGPSGRLDDDAPVAWTSRGPTAAGLSKPDLVAPGRSLVLTRSYGSTIERDNPGALVEPSYIRGSGSSQAAAVTSGVVALLLAARPELTPDQVKNLLVRGAVPFAGVDRQVQGAGRLALRPALSGLAGPRTTQLPLATGLGSLELSRGGRHVSTVCPGSATETVIIGEQDARCGLWNPVAWTGSTWTGSTWTGSTWTGSTWTGSTWTGSTWTGSTWTGSTWTGSTWTGSTWTGSDFQTAFWGARPKYGQKVAGERSEPAPKGLPIRCAIVADVDC